MEEGVIGPASELTAVAALLDGSACARAVRSRPAWMAARRRGPIPKD
jgi:hypothetical protein